MKQHIQTVDAPQAVGPYSQAVKAGEFLYASGQIPVDPQTGALVSDDFSEQTAQVLQNIHAVLEAAHMDFSNVIKATVFLTDLGNFQAMNTLYGECFGDSLPARSTIQVAALPMGSQVEIEFVAHSSDS